MIIPNVFGFADPDTLTTRFPLRYTSAHRRMAMLTWRSCTSGATVLSSFLGNLKSCPSDTTPLSDIRIPLSAATAYICVLMILSILPKPSFAHSRPFVLLAAFHNLVLSLGSLIMFLGALSATVGVATTQSFADTICTRSPSRLPVQIQFWLYSFYASKFYELLDTPILLLRNRSLTLLHVWHHVSVMFETWAWLEYSVTIGLYGMLFNTFVHVFMYAYYAAVLLKIPFPKQWITVTQIVQFLTSFAFLVPWALLNRQRTCTGAFGLVISGAINASYLLLFVRFYRKTYTSKRRGTKKRE